jgi:hypothetical protein
MVDVLEKVKAALAITGTYQDATLGIFIDEVKAYMKDAGVSEAVISSDAAVGAIVRGVTDLWNYNGGAGKLSEYFYQRVSQLCLSSKDGEGNV